jgi:catalase (peroxidase I)
MGAVDTAVSVCDIVVAHGHTTFIMSAADMAVFVCDVMAAPGRTTSALGTPDVPSYICSPVEAVATGTYLVGVVATCSPLLLASRAAPDDSWCTTRKVMVFLGAIYRGALRPPMLQKAP